MPARNRRVPHERRRSEDVVSKRAPAAAARHRTVTFGPVSLRSGGYLEESLLRTSMEAAPAMKRPSSGRPKTPMTAFIEEIEQGSGQMMQHADAHALGVAWDRSLELRAIWRWITENVAAEGAGETSPEGALRKRRAQCGGFAALFSALARDSGIECYEVLGYAKSADYTPGTTFRNQKPNHTWNVAKVETQWVLLDPCWGAGRDVAGVFEKRHQPMLFATDPFMFSFTHFPLDPKWQLMAQPLTLAQFESLPLIPIEFFEYGITWTVEEALQVPASFKSQAILSTLCYQRLSFSGKLLCAEHGEHAGCVSAVHLEDKTTLDVYVLFPHTGPFVFELSCGIPEKQGTDLACVYRGRMVAETVFDPKTGVAAVPSTVYNCFLQHSGQVSRPVGWIQLQSQLARDFVVCADKCTDVVVANGLQWTRLSRDPECECKFAGPVRLQCAPICVFGLFGGDDEVHAPLCEYSSEALPCPAVWHGQAVAFGVAFSGEIEWQGEEMVFRLLCNAGLVVTVTAVAVVEPDVAVLEGPATQSWVHVDFLGKQQQRGEWRVRARFTRPCPHKLVVFLRVVEVAASPTQLQMATTSYPVCSDAWCRMRGLLLGPLENPLSTRRRCRVALRLDGAPPDLRLSLGSGDSAVPLQRTSDGAFECEVLPAKGTLDVCVCGSAEAASSPPSPLLRYVVQE
eukprot:m51a1_g3501 hypothetical protein (683) ;mRNA; r:838520-841294